MSLAVYIDYGTGWIELTDYDGAGQTLVRKDGLSKTEILHKQGESVINTCSFVTDMPTGLANDLINLDQDTQIKLDIDKDGVNWFTGYARPVTSFNVSVENGYVNRKIEWEGVDSAWALKNVLSSGLSYSNKKVCDPADTANSLVHLLLTSAGILSSDINITVTIASTIPLLSLNADDSEYFEILSELLYYYGCSLNVAADGSFYVYRWADDNVPDKTTLDAWPSSESSFAANRNDIDSNRVQVKWSKVNTYSNRTIINVNANLDIEPLSGGKYPPDGSTEHQIDRELDNGDKITGVSNLRLYTYVDTVHAYEPGGSTPNKSVKKWIQSNSTLNFAVRNKYNWSRWGDNWAAISFTENLSEWKVNIQIDLNSNVNYQQLEYPYDYPDDVIATDSMGITLFKIGSYKVIADIETLGERWTTEVGTGQKLEKIEAEWIYSETNAEALAQAVLDLKEVSSKTFDIRVDEDVPVGTYRRLQNPHLNIDVVVRVLRKIDNIESEIKGYKVYRYTVEAVRPLSVLFSNVSGTSHTGQTAAEIELGSSSAVAGLTPDGKVIQTIESSILEEGFTPDKDGLYFSDTRLGFFKDGEWKSYLKNDATFKFLGDSDNFIEWNGSALKIQGDLQSANFVTGSAGWQINNAGDAEFNDVTVRGTIDADDGEVGGFIIEAARLYAGESEGARIQLDDTEKRFAVYDSLNNIKVALGYLGNIEGYTDTQYGLYIADGNTVRFEGGGELVGQDYTIASDGALVIDDGSGGEIGRYGSLGSGEIGFYIGDLDTGEGIRYSITQGLTIKGGLTVDDVFAQTSTLIDGGSSADTSTRTFDGGSASSVSEREFNDDRGVYMVPMNFVTINSPLFLKGGIMGDITSNDYEEGIKGYKIGLGGNVEFNNGTFRGKLDAATGNFGSFDDETGIEIRDGAIVFTDSNVFGGNSEGSLQQGSLGNIGITGEWAAILKTSNGHSVQVNAFSKFLPSEGLLLGDSSNPWGEGYVKQMFIQDELRLGSETWSSMPALQGFSFFSFAHDENDVFDALSSIVSSTGMRKSCIGYHGSEPVGYIERYSSTTIRIISSTGAALRSYVNGNTAAVTDLAIALVI